MTPLHTELRNKFELKYKEFTGIDYYWMAKDGKNLNQLIAQLKFFILKKTGVEATYVELINGFDFILMAITDKKELLWYKQNFTMSILNSKLSQIISTIKTSKKNESINTPLREAATRILRGEA